VQKACHDENEVEATLEVLVYQLRAAASRVRVRAPEVLDLSSLLPLLSDYYDARSELEAALVQLVMHHGKENP